MRRFERFNQKGRQTSRGTVASENTNAEVLPASTKEDEKEAKPVFQTEGEKAREEKKLGKKAKRFAAWLAKREKKEARPALYSTLAAHALPALPHQAPTAAVEVSSSNGPLQSSKQFTRTTKAMQAKAASMKRKRDALDDGEEAESEQEAEAPIEQAPKVTASALGSALKTPFDFFAARKPLSTPPSASAVLGNALRKASTRAKREEAPSIESMSEEDDLSDEDDPSESESDEQEEEKEEEDEEEEEEESDDDEEEEEEDEEEEEELPATLLETFDGIDGKLPEHPSLQDVVALLTEVLSEGHVAPKEEETPAAPVLFMPKAEAPLALNATHVNVQRRPSIQEARMQLPVCQEEDRIMEMIYENDIMLLCGETGSGKTTQVPQFLYEAGFGSSEHAEFPGTIAVTQPRRVAAMAMAHRVADELNVTGKDTVAYQVRFDGTVTPTTRIKFVTDGILLKEIATDFLLKKYSCIMVDEAHERSLNTDILIGMLSRIVKLRREMSATEDVLPLKVIIMSATLRVTDFTENRLLFDKAPPVFKVEARQHPVSMHFNRATPDMDHVSEAYDKILQIHERLPAGGLLVFLTGQDDIAALQQKLAAYTSSATLELRILPLYAALPAEQQMKVFAPVGEDEVRLCVLATNVAETSLTIPGIKYVVDCGKAKERVYDPTTGVQQFQTQWISKASAGQRAGRAGRTGPGHCYRLYSSAVFDQQFAEHGKAEIETMPIDGIMLQMKTMHIDNVVNFPFPSPPPRAELRAAERLLVSLEALDPKTTHITPIGAKMADFPVSPRFAKMILLGLNNQLSDLVMMVAAVLTVGDPFVQPNALKDTITEEDAEEGPHKSLLAQYHHQRRQFAEKAPGSDVFVRLAALSAFAQTKETTFCQNHFLKYKTMEEMLKLTKQLHRQAGLPLQQDGEVPCRLPSPKENGLLRQILLTSFIDQIAIRDDGAWQSGPRKGLYPYRTLKVAENVYVHPGSILRKQDPAKYVVFTDLFRSSKVYMKHVTEVEEEWIKQLGQKDGALQGLLDRLHFTKVQRS